MPCGLYGKLPVKRDFVAVNTPRDFLLLWEEWLQGGVSASKISLGHDWLRAYLAGLSAAGRSARTAARRLSAMRQFYRFLLREGVRDDDPTELLAAPRTHPAV